MERDLSYYWFFLASWTGDKICKLKDEVGLPVLQNSSHGDHLFLFGGGGFLGHNKFPWSNIIWHPLFLQNTTRLVMYNSNYSLPKLSCCKAGINPPSHLAFHQGILVNQCYCPSSSFLCPCRDFSWHFGTPNILLLSLTCIWCMNPLKSGWQQSHMDVDKIRIVYGGELILVELFDVLHSGEVLASLRRVTFTWSTAFCTKPLESPISTFSVTLHIMFVDGDRFHGGHKNMSKEYRELFLSGFRST